MIAVIDYGVGNLFSITSSLKACDVDCQVTRDESLIKQAKGLILPGVGAFGDAKDKLVQTGLFDLIQEEAEKGKPLLGICLGMQLLFEKSFEYGVHEGLSLLPGSVQPLRADLKRAETLVPHMGWNQLELRKENPLIQGEPYVYFVHSYYAKDCDEVILADAEYEGVRVPALVGRDHIFGMQFHPEKSGAAGLAMLKAFAALCQ